MQAVGSKIISLTIFWCTTLNSGLLHSLPPIMPMDDVSMPCQALIILGAYLSPIEAGLRLIEAEEEINQGEEEATQEDGMLGIELLD